MGRCEMSLNTIETPETAVGNLGIALGLWIASSNVSQIQIECFVESVCVLAAKADVKDELSVFDLPMVKSIVDKVFK